jgi:hypothetical protein
VVHFGVRPVSPEPGLTDFFRTEQVEKINKISYI